MRSTYGIIFLAISGSLFTLATGFGGWRWWLIWPALNFLALAMQYIFGWRMGFRKQSDGRLSASTVWLMLPFLAFVLSVWHIQRLLSNEPASNEVVPGLFVARRLLPGELPAGVSLIIDLTIEFTEPRAIRGACEYASFPILDATSPDDVEVQTIVDRIVRHSGPVVVHCANGHGRSATVISCALLAKGLACDVAGAIHQVRAARPLARLNADQRRTVETFGDRLL